jgi:hypothetical protein
MFWLLLFVVVVVVVKNNKTFMLCDLPGVIIDVIT